jgi:hypothetical protein
MSKALLGWILFVPGIILMVVAAVFILQNFRTSRWVPQEATVTGFATEPARGNKVRIKPGYEYTVDGQRYTGDRFAIPSRSFTSEEADALASRYTVGKSITVYRNPGNPAQAAVDTTFPTWTVMVGMLALALFAYGLAMIRGN